MANITEPADFMIPLAWDIKPENSSGRFSWKFSVNASDIRLATGVAKSLKSPSESTTHNSRDKSFGSEVIDATSVTSSSHKLPVAMALEIALATESETCLDPCLAICLA